MSSIENIPHSKQPLLSNQALILYFIPYYPQYLLKIRILSLQIFLSTVGNA